MAMSASTDLWTTFLSRLQDNGTSIEDIEDCTPQLLQVVLAELGFSALQQAKLQTEWSRRRSVQGQSGAPQLSSSTLLSAGRPREQLSSPRRAAGSRVPVAEASTEFGAVSRSALDFLATASSLPRATFTILGVERVANPHLDAEFADASGRLNSSLGGQSGRPTSVLWRYVALDDVDRVCQDGFDPAWASDALCSSGLVFFAPHTGLDAAHLVTGAGGDAPPIAKLAAVEVALGNVKVIDEEDATLLSHFSSAKCLRSLQEDGFDSVQIRRRAPHLPQTFLLFSGAQACPRHIVTFAYAGGGVGGTDGIVVSSPPSHALSGPRADVGGLQRAFCATHPNKEYEFWCEDEKKLLCSLCMFVNGYHAKRCCLLEEAAVRERAAVERWVASVDSFVRDAGSVMMAFDAAMDGVVREAEREADAFRDDVERLKEFLDSLVARHAHELKARASEQALTLQKALTQVVTAVSKAEDVAVLAKDAMRTGRPLDILIARQMSCQHWDQVRIPAYVQPAIRFEFDRVARAVEDHCQIVDLAGTVDLPEAIDMNNLRSAQP